LIGDGVVEHGLDLVPRQFVDEADLLASMKQGSHIMLQAIGEVDRENRATSVGDGGTTVVVQLLVVVGADVASREDVFEVLHEGGVDSTSRSSK